MMIENYVQRRTTFNQTIQNETFGKKQSCVSESNISIVSVTELHKKKQSIPTEIMNQINFQPAQKSDESN